MKKICFFVIIAMLLIAIILPAKAAESEPVEVNSETETASVHIDEEIASEVVDVVVSADSKNEAIILIANKLNVSVEKAEAIVDTIIATRDTYFGENAWWTGFKEDIISNRNFWITVILCILSGLTIFGMIFVFVAKINPTLNKSNYGMNKMFNLCSATQEANSQTLGKIEALAVENAEKEETYNKLLAEKEEHIEKLVERIAEMKAAAEKERRSMLLAEAYNLQILKLICSRTALPLADKAAIDLWYTKAIESIKSELEAEDIKKIENIAATLEVTNGKSE